MMIYVTDSLFNAFNRQREERTKGNQTVIKPGLNKQGWRLILCS